MHTADRAGALREHAQAVAANAAEKNKEFSGILNAAVSRLWAMTQAGRPPAGTGPNAVRGARELVRGQAVTRDTYDRVVSTMQDQAMHRKCEVEFDDPTAPSGKRLCIRSCASCGVMLNRGNESKARKPLILPADFGALDDVPEWVKKLAFVDGTVLNNRVHKFEQVFGKQLVHRYRGRAIGLYADLVHSNGVFEACHNCHEKILRKQTPPLSLLSGMLLFFPSDLPQLSHFERACVSYHRPYGRGVVKLKKNRHMSALDGHFVAFEHDAPSVIGNRFALPVAAPPPPAAGADAPAFAPRPTAAVDDVRRSWLADSMMICLVGTEDDMKKFKEDALKALTANPGANLELLRAARMAPVRREFWPLTIRPQVVIRYLKLFKALGHPAYKDLMFSDDVEQRITQELEAEQARRTWLASLKWADELAAWMNSLPR